MVNRLYSESVQNAVTGGLLSIPVRKTDTLRVYLIECCFLTSLIISIL